MIKRLIKFFVFGLVLALLSLGYKFFAGGDSKYSTFGGSNKASADVPGCASGSAEGSASVPGSAAGGSAGAEAGAEGAAETADSSGTGSSDDS